MQFRRSKCLYLLVVAALPVLAQAQPAASPQTLGVQQGIFDFCSRVDPQDDRKFDQQNRLMWQGMSEDAIERIRSSDAYRTAYKTIGAVLNSLSRPDALQDCRAIS